MKNALKYYYNLEPLDIHQINRMYKFNINSDYYYLFEINEELKYIENIYNLNLNLNGRGIYTIQIVLNNQNSIITYINQSNYVLLKSIGSLDKTITIDDIMTFNNITSGIDYNFNRRDNWYKLWINKMDYFEYQINELENKYPLIKECFNYFSGLTETAISLLYNMDPKPVICISHNRIKENTTMFDLYNPFNFIIDSNMRDIAEYIKSIKNISIIEKIINQLTVDELRLLFVRILYPSYYFDKYEEIIENNLEEEEIKKILNHIEEYELLIKKTYILLKDICLLPDIDWLIK